MSEKPKLEIPEFKSNIPKFLLEGQDKLAVYIATEINIANQRQEWIIRHITSQHDRLNSAETYIELDKKTKMGIGALILASAITWGKVGWDWVLDIWDKIKS